MSTLTGNTVVAHPITHEPQVLLAGDQLPDWAVGLVGEHLLADADEPQEDAPADTEDKPADAAPAQPKEAPPAEPADTTPVDVEEPPAANQPAVTPKRASRRR